MIRTLLSCLVALSLTACGVLGTLATNTPSSLSDQVKIDEQAGITVTLAYTAAAKVAGLSIETGIVKNPDTIKRIGELDQQAYAAVLAVRQAYLAANAASYAAALTQANAAVKALMAALGIGQTAVELPALPYQAVWFDATRAHLTVALANDGKA